MAVNSRREIVGAPRRTGPYAGQPVLRMVVAPELKRSWRRLLRALGFRRG